MPPNLLRLPQPHTPPEPLPTDRPDAFLHTLGLLDTRGAVHPEQRERFAQINAFLQAFDATAPFTLVENRPVRILDCASGTAHLTLALYHYLTNLRGIPTLLHGLDHDAALIATSTALSTTLACADAVHFTHTPIADHTPTAPPDIVLAVHACDTATDDALALAVHAHTPVILAVPCCHRHLAAQLTADTPAAFRPLLREAPLRTRLSDVLTDALRAQLLRLCGYEVDLIEFISYAHTARNVLIRALKRGPAEPHALLTARAEYQRLAALWGVQPYLEQRLADRLPNLWD